MGANRTPVGRAVALSGAFLIAMSGRAAAAATGEGILIPAGGIVRSSTALGARVRITLTAPPNRRIVGVITGVDGQTVTLVKDDRSDITLRLSAIAQLERSLGGGPRKTGKGFLAGAGTGAAVGFMIGSGRRCPGWFAPPGSPATGQCFLEPVASTVGGVLLGGGAGTLIGALSRHDRWTVVSLNWLDGK